MEAQEEFGKYKEEFNGCSGVVDYQLSEVLIPKKTSNKEYPNRFYSIYKRTIK